MPVVPSYGSDEEYYSASQRSNVPTDEYSRWLAERQLWMPLASRPDPLTQQFFGPADPFSRAPPTTQSGAGSSMRQPHRGQITPRTVGWHTTTVRRRPAPARSWR
jgi:hypothetical protein